jgi:hypothetical protein
LLELAAAAAGPRSGALKAMLELPKVSDIDAASQKRMLQFAVANHDDAVMHKLCSPSGFGVGLVPALQANDVLRLMFAALDADNCSAVMQLCSLTAALELSPQQLQLLMSAILSRRLSGGENLVCQLLVGLHSVAEQLQPNQVFDLMTEVVEMACSGTAVFEASGMVEALGELPYATNMQPELWASLLKGALTTTPSDAYIMIRELCKITAAQRIRTDQLAPVVHLALMRRSYHAAFCMLSLPCAQALAAEDIVRCIHVLLHQLRSIDRVYKAQDIFTRLVLLPGAREIQASQLQQLLQTLQQILGSSSEKRHPVPVVAWLQPLLGLLPHDDAGAAVIEQLLCYALQHNTSSATQLLLVKAADMLDAAAVQRLLELAINAACKIQQQQQQALPAAAPAAALFDAVERICDLPGAQQLQPDVLGELLQSALVRRTPEVLKSLAQVEGAAERMEKGVLLGLLKTAMQRMTGRVSVCTLFDSNV